MVDEPIPTCTAMLACDQVTAEQGTNKKSLIGIFEMIGSVSFPVVIPRISVYVKLLDGFGTYPFKLRIVNLKDETLLADVRLEANLVDRLHSNELVFNFVGLPLPEAGRYEFQLYVHDIFLQHVTIDAQQIQPGGALPWQQQQVQP